MASHAEIFGAAGAAVLRGYLDRLSDRYRVLLVDYPVFRPLLAALALTLGETLPREITTGWRPSARTFGQVS